MSNNKRAATLVLVLSFLMTSQLICQNTDDEEKNTFLNNKTLNNTKSLQKYYQNIFQKKQKETLSDLIPSFDVDKEMLLEKLKEAIPIDGPINPDKYYVGPGDILEINVWSDIPFNFTAIINPEGKIIIPTIGEIDLRNSTLSQAKSKVEDVIGNKFLKAEVTTNLIHPRIFSVTVSGIVNNPGSYYANALQRVDQVIYLANMKLPNVQNDLSQLESREREKLNRPEAIKYFDEDIITEKELKFSLRNIKVIRRSGDTINVDLVSYYSTGSLAHNPYLMDGDRVIVPNLSMEGNSISISGAVRLEGTYEYSPTDSLGKIFQIAQGPTATADLRKIDLYRYSNNSKGFQHFEFNLEKIITGETEDIQLMPNDRIAIREIYPRPANLSVRVIGEVKYPGLYPIVYNKTKLADIIANAGGFTTEASLADAKVLRQPGVKDPALENPDYVRLLNLRLSDLDEEEREYFNYESAIKRNFLSVDFRGLFVDGDSSHNVKLIDNDIILVPRKTNAVYVYGQVAKPGYIDYRDDLEYEDYIRIAGNYTVMASDGDTKIIKAGSNNWLDPDDTKLEPGDSIFVPREKDRDFEYYFGWFSRIVGVLGGIATIIILVTRS